MSITLERPERVVRFACFGGTVAIRASGEAEEAIERGRALALEAHARLTRFDPDSELSR